MAGRTYRSSGVDLDVMENLKERIKAFAAITHGPEVLGAGGSFAGLYQLAGFRQPVLVASADGVGTKLKIASLMGHFESVGQDLVTLNVNDILTRGARPLFFLDYVAFSRLDPMLIENLMRGIVWGCREVGCALIGGETAQMPGMYASEDFDLAGFVVGAVEQSQVINGKDIKAGDRLLGIPSSGVHTNGFSLVRSVFGIDDNPSVLFQHYDELNHQLGEELLVRHRSYYPMLQPVLESVKALAHITGGGLPGKVPAILPGEVSAEFQVGSWAVPPIFNLIQQEGGVGSGEMFRVFNMGLGMVAVVAPEKVDFFRSQVPDSVVVGQIVPQQGDERVRLIGI